MKEITPLLETGLKLSRLDAQCHNQQGQIPSTINTLTPAEADALTTWSSLSKSASWTSSDAKYANDHPLGVCSDDTYHEVKCTVTGRVRTEKRKKRGKCTECGTNTRYYCIVCEPRSGCLRHWCCPDTTSNNNKRMCHTQHRQKCAYTS